MQNRRNYQRELEQTISQIEDKKIPKLLLHSCCAPCSSYCLEYLSEFFSITIFYYNPNIEPLEEYEFRVKEIERLLSEMPFRHPVSFIEGNWDNARYHETVRGLESEPEGGERCEKCFQMRLEEAALLAKKENFDYFTTTLTISPLKSAEKLNTIGESVAEKYGVNWLNSDFKKKGGYQRSIELSRIYELYRQNYCGCVYSKR